MTLDTGRYLRLQGAIDGALKALPEGSAATASGAYSEAYVRLREQARAIVDAEFRGEFDKLFPEWQNEGSGPSQRVRFGAGFDPFKEADKANRARTLLATMSGWLGGFVQQAEMEERAKAYAVQRDRLGPVNES